MPFSKGEQDRTTGPTEPARSGRLGSRGAIMPAMLNADQDDDLHARARAAVTHWVNVADRLCPRLRLPQPVVRFDLKGLAAGQAHTQPRGLRRRRDVIRLNPTLLARHPREMLEETVPHEVAHLVIGRRYGRRAAPHGPEWRSLMAAFGVPARACHTLRAEPSRRLRRYRYHCACPEAATLTSIRHNRARRGTRYLCRRCGETLLWAGEHA